MASVACVAGVAVVAGGAGVAGVDGVGVVPLGFSPAQFLWELQLRQSGIG